MLTPRRTMLLLAGFVLFAGAYAAYAQLLGWLDGLPQLPAKFLDQASGPFAPPERNVSQAQQKLIEAFGENSPETNYSHYEMQFGFPSGEYWIVVAAGKPPSNANSKRVTLSPFSIAIFSKAKPPHLRQPGEVAEISTIHADKGVLEFDRVITNPTDMQPGKSKLVRIELVSDFADALPDPRRGVVHITNNQRSSDPNRFLVLRTVGPVFYRDPKAAAGTPAAQGPDFWTDAPVEIVDRQNLPRPIGSAAPATVPTKSEENRAPSAVAGILSGQRLPPPTVTAIGLRVYLEPSPPPGQKKKEPPPGSNTVTGVKRLEFLEQVVMNLWVDNGQSLVGGAPAPAPDRPAPAKGTGLALVPPPAAIAAVTGGLATAAYNARLANRALLQIDTRGPFAYDAEKAVARFDVMPHSDPNLPNDVQVTKIPAHSGSSSLFSQVLELEFNGSPTGTARPSTSPAIKRLHAWTSTPGRYLTLTSQDEAAEAYGQDLVHDQAADRTVLSCKSAPLYVINEGNVLTAGGPQTPATLTIEPGPPLPNPVSGGPPVRKRQTTVRGPGKVELFDAATRSTGTIATWQTSLVQKKDVIADREQDLFVLTDGAKFEDLKADYWLKAGVLKLWLEPRAEPLGTEARSGPKPAGGAAKPSLVQAVGKVESHSTDYDIVDADQLTVHIKEPAPVMTTVAAGTPQLPVSPAGPMGAVARAPQPPVSPAGPVPTAPKPSTGAPAPAAPKLPVSPQAEPVVKAPEKPKPPYKIRAKTIETFLTRTAPAAAAAKPGAPAPAAKYQLDRARCEDNVFVHQDPTDPTKSRGVDIIGRLLLIDGSADGSVMTVFGGPNRFGEVHQDEMSLIGPKVVLNQVLNSAAVDGRGSLTMPTGSDLSGSELARPEVVIIHWRDSMAFSGAQKSAVFVGKVQAQQGESSVQCHTMNVVFDRPLYFNQAQRQAAKPAPNGPQAQNEKAKIDKVFCYPAPADSADHRNDLLVRYDQVDYDKDGKLLKVQRLTATELKMEAQARDDDGGEPYPRIRADGPGTLRIWQPGDTDPAGPPGGAPKPPAPKQPVPPGAQPPAKGKQEMKLTVIDFNNCMTAIDKKKVYQRAVFSDDVTVISVPTDSPSVHVDPHNLPPRAVLLKCTEKLDVWSHKKGNAPPVQHMNARGNAYVRSDEYDGFAPTITSEGKTVTLFGTETIPARVMSRFERGNEQVGKTIVYDRANGSSSVIDSFGGKIMPKNK